MMLQCAAGPSAKPKAASTLNCGQNQISIEEDPANVNMQVAKGCSKTDVMIFDARQNGWSSLRERAAFDLSCSSDLAVMVMDRRTFGVAGCNKKATYVLSSSAGLVMNVVQDVPAASAPSEAK